MGRGTWRTEGAGGAPGRQEVAHRGGEWRQTRPVDSVGAGSGENSGTQESLETQRSCHVLGNQLSRVFSVALKHVVRKHGRKRELFG
jgi:hypothetical protein